MASGTFWEPTIQALTPFIQQTPLSEKLLSKPPFRYLHDLISEFIRNTEFATGLYDDEELNASNVKDKDAKISWLTKIIRLTELTSGSSIKAKSAKIIAGLDPADTNAFLQLLSKQAKVNTDDLVEKCGGKKPIKKALTQPEPKKQEQIDKENIPLPQELKKPPVEKTQEEKASNDAILKEEKTKEAKLLSKEEMATSSTSVGRTSPIPSKTNVAAIKETKAKHVESTTVTKTKSNSVSKGKPTTSTSSSKLSSSSSSSHRPESSTEKMKTTSPSSSAKKVTSPRTKPTPALGTEPMAVLEPSKPSVSSVSTSLSSSTPMVSFAEKKDKIEKDLDAYTAPPPPPGAAAGALSPSLPSGTATHASESEPTVTPPHPDIPHEEPDDVRPVTFTKRPATARKPPPKLRPETTDVGGTGVSVPLVDAYPEEDMFVVTDTAVGAVKGSVTTTEDTAMSKDDLVVLRDQVQSLTRCIHPLGKLLEYLQEDMELMNTELEKWRAASTEYVQSLATETDVTKAKLGPLEDEVKKIDDSIALELEKLEQVKLRVLMNEETMQQLVNQLVATSH